MKERNAFVIVIGGDEAVGKSLIKCMLHKNPGLIFPIWNSKSFWSGSYFMFAGQEMMKLKNALKKFRKLSFMSDISYLQETFKNKFVHFFEKLFLFWKSYFRTRKTMLTAVITSKWRQWRQNLKATLECRWQKSSLFSQIVRKRVQFKKLTSTPAHEFTLRNDFNFFKNIFWAIFFEIRIRQRQFICQF